MSDTATAPSNEPGLEAIAGAAPRNPLHSMTQATFAPTSEFARYFLLALPARYVFRGILGKKYPMGVYNNALMGAGSVALTGSYAFTVYRDMFHIFSEAVGYETNEDPAKITFGRLRRSDNKIVTKTLHNWFHKNASRLATDSLFFLAPLLHVFPSLQPSMFKNAADLGAAVERMGDTALGIKGAQLFIETWNREPTLFEHLTALVHSKINPKNGLGQPLTTDEVLDLYQHYMFQFNPDHAFKSVIDTDPVEARIWGEGGQAIIERITRLMNLTYSYKHATEIDSSTHRPIARADLALPKFIYLLGHDLIDLSKPVQTMLYIETANAYGMQAVKDIRSELAKGTSINTLLTRYPVKIDLSVHPKEPFSRKVGTVPTADLIPTTALASEPSRQTTGTLATTALMRE